MATYIVGDIQGCLSALKRLLAKVQFNPAADTLLVAGDVVSRGEDSLGTLRFLYGMRHCVDGVLGNHDLHLLALASTNATPKPHEWDLADILQAPDRQLLLEWLQSLSMALYFPEQNALLTHAGWPPQWRLAELLEYSGELESVLHSSRADAFFKHMYGNEPKQWSEQLTGMPRLRLITNYLTRMRFVDAHGALNLKLKCKPQEAPEGYQPWFQATPHHRGNTRIIFGHWAALEGKSQTKDVEAIDTGCVWGGELTAYCLESQERFSVAANKTPSKAEAFEGELNR